MRAKKSVTLVVFLLMLAGIIIYIFTMDESEPLGGEIETTQPAHE
jgi:hypothetical protein